MRYMIGIGCDDDTEDLYEVDRAMRECADKFPLVTNVLSEGIKEAMRVYPRSRLLMVRRKHGSLHGFTWYSRYINKCKVHAIWMAKGKRKIGLRREMLDQVHKFVGKNIKVEVPIKKRVNKTIVHCQ